MCLSLYYYIYATSGKKCFKNFILDTTNGEYKKLKSFKFYRKIKKIKLKLEQKFCLSIKYI